MKEKKKIALVGRFAKNGFKEKNNAMFTLCVFCVGCAMYKVK